MKEINALVLEDENTNALYMRRVLEGLGCRVMSVADGLDALDLLSKQEFDVAFLDWRVPGMNGLELIRRLRGSQGLNSNLPVIMATANAFEEDRVRCIGSGADYFLPKPFSRDEIEAALLHVLPRD